MQKWPDLPAIFYACSRCGIPPPIESCLPFTSAMFTMNRAELIEFIAVETDLSKAATGRVLDVLPETIQTTVKQGKAL